MTKNSLLFAALVGLLSFRSFATVSDSVVCHLTDVEGRYREHNTDFQKISLDVKFLPKEGKVMGRETLTFTPIQPAIDSLYLDGPGIVIKKMLLDNQAANITYQTTKEGIIVRFPARKLKWDEKHSINLEYEATPRKGLYFIGWNDEKNLSRKQIWTQGQGVDNRYWFPCYDDVDDKVITETTVTFDKDYTVVSNGNLIESKLNADNTKTWHYTMTKPHAAYLVMLAIDKYARKDIRSNNGIVSRQYFYADHPDVADPTYENSKEMMDWLPKEIGVPFPWPSYSNSPVQDFMFGAMENTTATIYGDFYQLDKRSIIEKGYMGVNAHELTHQWFGDYITEYSATHHWLHESFATYYSKMFMRHMYGEDQYDWTKRTEAASAINADRENRYPIAHGKAGSARHYPKGSFVIGMLRYVLGDDVYHRAVQQYLKKHALGNVDTHDFYRTFQETCGINLDWFFDEWVYHSGVPNYEVHYEPEANKTTFFITQTHATDSLTHLFKMPIVLEVYYTDGTKDSVRAMVSEKSTTIAIPNPIGKKIDYTLFDPSYNVLHTLTTSKSYNEWLAQATKAHSMIDRLDAVLALKDTALERKRSDLIILFNKEKSYNVRAEIISQFKLDSSEQSITLFKKALNDEHYLVRRAVIDQVLYIPTGILSDCERLLTDTSYFTIENTLRKLCKQYPANKERYLATTKNTIGISKNVRVAWLEINAETNPEASRNELIDYASHSYEFRTRVKAMEAMERINYCNEAMIKNLFDAILNPNTRLAGPADRLLHKLMSKAEVKEMAKAYYMSNTWKDWQDERLKKLFE